MKPEEALEQVAYLRELAAQSRLRAAEGYPYFLLWGVVCAVGYLGSLRAPQLYQALVWPAVYVVGLGGSVWIGLAAGRRQPVPPLLRKVGWSSLALALAGVGLAVLLDIHHDRAQANFYWPYLVGVIYLAESPFMGGELAAIGAWLVAAATASYWMPSPVQNIWLAVAVGGGLLVTGWLLRRQVRTR